MIVSDRYRFIFIHIPKCAGTSVRRVLNPYHDGDPRFLEKVEHHPGYGEVDFTHIPLNLLVEMFPDIFRKLKLYRTYAVVRDPELRFQSAMAQRAKMYLGCEIAQLSQHDIRIAIEDVISHLQNVEQVTSPEFIHFSRQSDFIYFNGEQVIDYVLPVEALNNLAREFEGLIGSGGIEFGYDNRTRVFRYPEVRYFVQAGNSFAKSLLPVSFHERAKRTARRILMKAQDRWLLPAFKADEIKGFVQSYYARDAEIYRKALQKYDAAEPRRNRV